MAVGPCSTTRLPWLRCPPGLSSFKIMKIIPFLELNAWHFSHTRPTKYFTSSIYSFYRHPLLLSRLTYLIALLRQHVRAFNLEPVTPPPSLSASFSSTVTTIPRQTSQPKADRDTTCSVNGLLAPASSETPRSPTQKRRHNPPSTTQNVMMTGGVTGGLLSGPGMHALHKPSDLLGSRAVRG